jgi:hypothetical protein
MYLLREFREKVMAMAMEEEMMENQKVNNLK